MAIDAFEPDGAVRHRGVEVGGGREAAEAPALLVPPAADDPAPLGIGAGVFRDLRLDQSALRRVGRAQDAIAPLMQALAELVDSYFGEGR